MSMGVHQPSHLDLGADDEDPSQLIIRPGWDSPHVRCFPRTFCAWPCLLRQVGTVLGSPYDYALAGLAYANPGSRQEGAALQWWENFMAMQPVGHVVTWEEFCDDFRGYHIPDQLMERKREQLCNLTQGKMTVHDYRTEFTRLARYAQEEVSTNAKKQARFRKGLSPILRHDLNLACFL